MTGTAGRFRQSWARTGADKGFALVVVILILLLVSFLVSQLVMKVRTELKVATNVKQRTAGYFLSEAGVSMAIFRILDKPVEDIEEKYTRFTEGYPYEELLTTGRVKYYAVNESGKIDLNSFPRRLMELFLEYHGLDEEQMNVVIDSILDWRDPDDLHRINGAESETYETLDDPYIARNGRIEDPSEFFLIHGTDLLGDRFLPEEVFTVNNPQSRINFNSLTPAMLDFLTGGDGEKIEAYRLAQEELEGRQMLSSAKAREILGDERFDALKQFLTYSSSRNTKYYIEAVGEAGYNPETDPALQSEGEEPFLTVPVRKLPGVKVIVVVERSRTGMKFLSWKEVFI